MRSNVIARGGDWSMIEQVCGAGPGDRPFEERHDSVVIAAVVEGTFEYRTDTGSALLYPGAVMLGNHGACFECGHRHGSGDRCIAVHVAPELFDEIAAFAAGSARLRFPSAMLPAAPGLAAATVGLQTLAMNRDPMAHEQSAMTFVQRILEYVSDRKQPFLPSTSGQRRAISDALRHIEDRAEETLSLSALAALASMSKFHFLHTFRQATGLTPYHYVIGTRLRRVAGRLRRSRAPVSEIAFDAGFGDLSTFNRQFKRTFAMSPREYRARA